MSFIKKLLLSIFSGVLLSIAWPVDGFYALIFIAWIPLLMLEKSLSDKGKTSVAFIGYSLISMLVWNVLTTWWIKNASFGGALMAIIANSVLMAVVLYLFHFIKTR